MNDIIDKITLIDCDNLVINHNSDELLFFKENQIREIRTLKKDERLSIPCLIKENGPGWYYFVHKNKICRSFTIKEGDIVTDTYCIQVEYEQDFLYIGIFLKGKHIPKYSEENTFIQRAFNEFKNIYRRLRALPLMFLSQFIKQRKELILVGENLGTQTGGNGYIFFNKLRKRNIYFVTRKNTEPKSSKNIIKFNSLEHIIVFIKSKNLLFTHGPKDLVPTIFLWGWYFWNNHNVYYLQHGIIALKQIGLSGNSYFGSLKGLVVSNPIESEICEKVLGFSRKQLIESAQPVHESYVMRQKQKRIFVCPTWGDYGTTDAKILNIFLEIFIYLPNTIKNSYEIIFKVHPYVSVKSINILKDQGIKIGDKSIQHYLETSEIVITDYSSIVWYGLFLKCKIINLFHSFYNYCLERDMYVPSQYLSNLLNICKTPEKVRSRLIELINEEPLGTLPQEFTTFDIKNRSEYILKRIME